MKVGTDKIKKLSDIFIIASILLTSIFISSCGGKIKVTFRVIDAEATPTPLVCPAEYIEVPANLAVGTTEDFCVSKYEMKNVAGVATSQALLTPWVSINQTNSKIECSNLGASYHLITNPEWMTVARNIEAQSINWSSGVIGTGMLNTGHSENSPVAVLSVSNTSDPYDQTGNNSGQAVGGGWEQKRTHIILTSSGNEEIWDFAGNANEWVDWYVSPANKAYDSGDGGPVAGWVEWSDLDTNINNGDDMEPITWQSLYYPAFDSTNGIGAYISGTDGSSGYANRGGAYYQFENGGIFKLGLSSVNDVAGSTRGSFRCVYKP